MKTHGVYRPNCAWYVLISVEELSPCPTVVALALQCMAVAYPGNMYGGSVATVQEFNAIGHQTD